ncbi:MAG: efflux RND transporter permease subunit [Methylovulum sp.]
MKKIVSVLRLSWFVTQHPWWMLLISLGVMIMMIAGVRALGFQNDYRVYFSKENPQLIAFDAIQNTYNKSDNVMFLLAPADGAVFTESTLQAIVELTEKAWQLPYSNRVDSISNFQNTVARQDDLIVSDLVKHPDTMGDTDRERIKQIALHDPELIDYLISKSGHVTGVNVTVQLPQKSASESVDIAIKARQLVAEIESKYPGVKVYLSGGVMMNNAFFETVMNDNQTLVPLMSGIVILALLVCLRSVSATFAVLGLLGLSVAGALGMAGWFGWDLNPTSAIAPTIILTMAVADCVHILVTALQSMRLGNGKKQALQESINTNFHPMFITSLTTAIGFAGMNSSDAPPFRDLGNIVSMGTATAWVLAVTFLPALMMVLPVRVKVRADPHLIFMDKLASFVIRQRKKLLVINGVIAIALMSCIPLNELNDEFVKYFDETVEFRQSTDFMNDNMGGLYNMEFSLHAGTEGGISEPEFLKKIQRFSDWLAIQPEIVHVNTLTDTFNRLNKNMHGDDSHWYRLPESRDLAAQYLLLYEISLPYGLDLNDRINVDKSSLRLVALMKVMSSNNMLAAESRVKDWLKTNMPEISMEVASPILMFAHIGERNIKSMLGGTALALVSISLMLIFAFRSVKLGLISMIPNLAPAGIAFGFWGLINGQVGLGLSVVTSMTLGIVVDDTIHFLSKYRQATHEKGLDSADAVRYAFSSVGVAMGITSVVLVAGFMVLSLSHFNMNSDMGLLTAIVITVAMLLELFLLPPLLMALPANPVPVPVARTSLYKTQMEKK